MSKEEIEETPPANTETRAETKKTKYPVSPYGVHVKQCVSLTLGWNPDTQNAMVRKWLFVPEDFPCPRCRGDGDIVFMRQSLGVFKSCKECGFTERVYAIEPITKKQRAIAVGDPVQMNARQLRGICAKYRINLPPSLPAGRSRKSRRVEDE